MNSSETTNWLKRRWLATLKTYENEARRANNRRNAAAIANFTKNIFSLMAQSKGLRYNVGGTSRVAAANAAYEEAQKRYRDALVDYEGKIASLKLQPTGNVQPGGAVTNKPLPQISPITAKDISFKKPFPTFNLGKPANNSFTPIHHSKFQIKNKNNYAEHQ